jgi:hypothetical protein
LNRFQKQIAKIEKDLLVVLREIGDIHEKLSLLPGWEDETRSPANSSVSAEEEQSELKYKSDPKVKGFLEFIDEEEESEGEVEETKTSEKAKGFLDYIEEKDGIFLRQFYWRSLL